MVEVSRSSVLGGNVKNLAMHRRDEDTYKQHLSAFKKTFPDFIYQSPNSLEPSSSI